MSATKLVDFPLDTSYISINSHNVNEGPGGYTPGGQYYTHKSYYYKYTINIRNIIFKDMETFYDDSESAYFLRGVCSFTYMPETEFASAYHIFGGPEAFYDHQPWESYDDSSVGIKLWFLFPDGITREKVMCHDFGHISSLEPNQEFLLKLGATMPQEISPFFTSRGVVVSTEPDIVHNEDFNIGISNQYPKSDWDTVNMNLNELIATDSGSTPDEPADPDDPDSPPVADDTPKEKYIVKDMVAFDGWRYLIGIRDINIRARSYEPQSEIISKKFQTKKPIKKILLYSKELIPEKFLESGLDSRNDWVQYHISINDTDWHRISPMHHNKVGDLEIAPKIYEINSTDSNVERKLSLNKGYLTSNSDIYSIRLKITITRPSTLESFTPILEEYALKCILEEEI